MIRTWFGSRKQATTKTQVTTKSSRWNTIRPLLEALEDRTVPAYLLGGPAGSLSPSSGPWSWDGPNMTAFRAAITNPANFGPGGVVNNTITTTNLSTINPGTLAPLDGFIATFWSDADSAPYVTSVVNFFLAGGDLILLQDHSSFDAVGQALGIPTFAFSNGSLSNDGAPLHNGPFGVAANVSQAGTVGQLNAADVAARNGTVASVNGAGQVTAAVWNAGQYQAGAGKLLIVADVDMWSTAFGNVSYAPLNDNGRFALNGMAFVAAANTPPSNVIVNSTTVNEAAAFNLTGSFTDPDAGDAHTVTINWGDGSPNTVLNLGAGVTNFSAPHTYADDNPTTTPNDNYTVTATVEQVGGGATTVEFSTGTYSDRPPNNAPDTYTEDGFIFETEDPANHIDSNVGSNVLFFHDGVANPVFDNFIRVRRADNAPFALTSFRVDNPGPSGITFINSLGQSFVVTTPGVHTPPGGQTWSGITFFRMSENGTQSTVQVDDFVFGGGGGGSAMGTGTVTVNNVVPNSVAITNGPFSVNENGAFTLNGSFSDTGLQDVHTVEVDWNGDGVFEFSSVLAVGARTFSFASPTYGDDGSSPGNGTAFDINNVNVRVRDDDSGLSIAATSTVTVNNVAPNTVAVTNGPFTINENGSFTLNGSFVDPGLADVHTVEVDWDGDGTYEFSSVLTTGDRSFSFTSPVFDDDNPTGTAMDTSAVNVRVSDDDTGVGLGGSTLTVVNVAPTITNFDAIGGVDGSGNAAPCNPVTFQVDLTDPSPAASETFRYEFDWDGNGSVDETVPLAGFTASRSITITHEFDANTTFQVRGVDDDTGVGAWFTRSITVVTITIIDGNLVIGGSNAADNISVNTYNPASIGVHRNGVNTTWTGVTGRVIIRGCDGNDVISVNGPVSAEIFGGNGNDFLYGGSGADQISGEAGDDYISAGAGHDVGIGGLGRDLLFGGNNDDILVGGHVDPMTWDWTALQGASSQWSSYAGPAGTGPAILTSLAAATTDPLNTANFDRFWGNTGKDAFLYRSGTGGDQVNDYSLSARDYLLALT
jgi:hypothetical protein